MKRLLIVAAIAVIAVPAFAGSDLLPITGSNGMLHYQAATGQVTPFDAQARRIGATLWAATESSGYFTGRAEGDCLLDWGDVSSGVTIGGLGFSEYTNSQASAGDNQVVVVVYQNDNGWGDTQKQILAGFTVANIPGSTHPANEYWGYLWRLEPATPFLIDGNDLDGDGLDDFSYAQWYESIRTPNAIMGPGINGTADPNVIPPECPGIENAFDRYPNPDFENDPNLATVYIGSYWFGGNPFAQFFWEMFAPGCPNAGAHFKYCAADIGNFNCIVDLADLSQLLGHYGTGTTYPEGDIYPPDDFFPGDGVIDLQDLAEILGQYGDNCNWPLP
jgi:hypothetical protein